MTVRHTVTKTVADRMRSVLLSSLAVVAVAAAVVTIVGSWGRPGADGYGPFGASGALRIVAFCVYAMVGVLVAARRPRNPIGWLFLAGGTAMTFQLGLEEYAKAAVEPHPAGAYPAAVVVDWVAEWLWIVPMFCLQFAILLFPTGELPSRRWRPYAAVLIAGDAVLLVLAPVALWPLRGQLAREEVVPEGLLWSVVQPVAVAMAVGVVLSAVALLARYRVARGDERYQLRWLAFAAVTFVGGMALESVFGVSVVEGGEGGSVWPSFAGSLGTVAIPVAAAFAILKRRLYEIDRVISRAVAYTIVSLVLAGTYLGLVVVLGSVATAVSGSSGDLVVALATLAVAALFQPMRRQIQQLVDRRFNRARYDAARTIDAFGRSLRDEVSRDAVLAELRATAAGTFQPASVGVVLTGGGER